MAKGRPSIVLSMGNFCGTLAAARDLGSRGVPVTMAEWRLWAPALWSRHVSQRLRCPPVARSREFVSWLLECGAKTPGQVLYPTSDDMTFLFSLHAEELGKVFRLYQPPLNALLRMLDKRELYAGALAVGMEVPETFFPEDDAHLAEIARTAAFPVLIKQRTQILSLTQSKGAQVDRPKDLAPEYARFLKANEFASLIREVRPEIQRPMLQRYLPEAAENIYSLTGFIDEHGNLLSTRGAVKVLQRPRRLGIGLCFDHAAVDARLAAQVEALCRRAGFFGAFDCELIRQGDRFLLIDFNPRFYNQLGFDLARGMPLAWMVYLAALGDRAGLEQAARDAAQPHDGPRSYCNRFDLELALGAQRLAGRLPPEERRRWRSWLSQNGDALVDAVSDWRDPLPALVNDALELYRAARAPRVFVRKSALE